MEPDVRISAPPARRECPQAAPSCQAQASGQVARWACAGDSEAAARGWRDGPSRMALGPARLVRVAACDLPGVRRPERARRAASRCRWRALQLDHLGHRAVLVVRDRQRPLPRWRELVVRTAAEAAANVPPRPAATSPERAVWRPLASLVPWRRELAAALPESPPQRCRAAARRPPAEAAAVGRRALQVAREDRAAGPPGGGSGGTWPARWGGPVEAPWGFRRARSGAANAAEWAGRSQGRGGHPGRLVAPEPQAPARSR